MEASEKIAWIHTVVEVVKVLKAYSIGVALQDAMSIHYTTPSFHSLSSLSPFQQLTSDMLERSRTYELHLTRLPYCEA